MSSYCSGQVKVMLRKSLLLWFLVFLVVSVHGQDSTGFGQTVRIVRAYDPNLPDWFRFSSDPILFMEPTTRIPFSYRPDSLSFVHSFGPIPKYNEPSLDSSTLQPQLLSRASITAGGIPGSQGNLGAEWSGPLRIGSQRLFGKLDFQAAFGNSNRLWADSIQSLTIWNPRVNLGWYPAGSRDWHITLEASQRSSRFNFRRILSHASDTTPSKYTLSGVQWNNLRVNPRIAWNRVSQFIDGLHQHLVLEGFGIKNWSSTKNWNSSDRFADLGSDEWAGMMVYQIGYTEDVHDLGLKLDWSNSSMLSRASDNLNQARSTFSVKPSWVWSSGQHRLSVSVDFVRQREKNDSSSFLVSSWVSLPQLIWQYRQPSDPASNFKGPWMIELGVISGILQPSLYHWSLIYPTISTVDAYQASVQRAEGFIRFEHTGGSGLRWQHRAGLGSWTNARFFELDTNSVMGVAAVNLPNATKLSWETRVSPREQIQMQCSFSAGMQGIILNRSWNGMPGLQPVLWGNLFVSKSWGKAWKLDFQSTVYALDSKRMVSNKLSTTLKWPTNLDLSINRSVSKRSSIAVVFRQRQAAPWLLWAEDVWWGRFFNVEWRWKI